jgi:hypothetical protein
MGQALNMVEANRDDVRQFVLMSLTVKEEASTFSIRE